MPPEIRILASVHKRLLVEARSRPHMECCGLLAGRAGVITTLLPATNALASATAFEIAARELFALFREMRGARLDHLGIYHSHPSGDNSPSPRDIERGYYPDTGYFIVTPREDAPRPVRAFSIREGRATEIALEIVEEDGSARGTET